MARIFSWYIKDEKKQLECFSYLAQSGSSGTYGTGSMVLDNKIESSETLKKIADVVSKYTESDYQTQFNNMKTKVAEKGLNPVWKDYTYYYDVNGNNLIMLTGNGEIGPQGPQGIQGEKGETGSAGNGRNVMCYCGLDEGIIPTRANVTGGKFYPNKWEIEFPTDPKGVCVWQDSNEFGYGKVVWMTNADFPSSTGDSPSEAVTPVVKIDSHGQEYTWATPIQISGPKGDNGADGERIEFVYKRCHKRTDPVPDRPTGTTEEQAKQQGWEDHPLGVVGDSDNPNENWRVEYMCQHIKDEEGNWGEFSDPILWASWGEDGNDGDGIEYIFAVTKDYSAPGNLPKSTDDALSGHWQDPEIWDYIREHGLDTRYAPWTDDPKDVSADEPYEWVSIRRRKWNASQDKGVFGEFGAPKLWAHWGKDGEKGNDGTSVDIRDQADTLGKLFKKLGNDVPQVGFSYAIGVNGKRVYVWMEQDSSYQTGRSIYNPPMSNEWYNRTDEDIYKNWYYLKDNKKYWFTDCGSFYGEPGKNAYVHMKYGRDYKESYGIDHRTVVIDGKSVDICFTINDGETPGKYIATYTDDIFDDRGDLEYYDNKWSKWEGDDGQSYGQEQIFFRSKTKINFEEYTKIATEDAHGYKNGEKYLDIIYPDKCFTTPDYTPSSWTDVPLGIAPGEWNFEYVSVRRLVQDGSEYDGTWSYFSIPALYNEAVDTPTFQVEYTKWTGTTKPVLTDANNYTKNGIFDEVAWRKDNVSTGPWSDDNDEDTTWMAQCNGYFENSDETKLKWNDWIVFRCKGHDGARGNGRNIMAYCSLPQGYTPTQANITGGKFYPNKWDISYPTDPVGINGDKGRIKCSWGDSNEPSDPSYMVWMINADFPNSTGSSKDEAVDPIVKTNSTGGTYTWSKPLCITGEKGDNGADGDSIEYIYFRTADNTIVPDRPGGMSDPDYQKPDFTPEVYINGIDKGEKWKDHPFGIEEDFRCEWMSQRTKDSATGLWGAFSDVAPWSRWGEDGIDGDGIEYIFAITSEMTEQAKNSIIAKLPRSTDAALSGQWGNPEIWDYIREHGLESAYSPWTDDPKDVGPTEPYEWVCMRKRKWDETLEDSKFGEFGDPVLWGRWNETVFTSFAFTELLSGPDYNISDCIVTGGSFDNPIPTTTKRGSQVLSYVKWTDGPTSTSAGTQIWMTKATFSNSGATGMILGDGWSKPELMADTENFEVMYSPRNANTLEALPPNFKKTGVDIDSGWLALAVQKGWYDEVSQIPDGQKAIYMATIKGHNNVWDKDGDGNDDWQILEVKGEKGDPGINGVSKFKSIVFKRTNTKPSAPTIGSYTEPVPKAEGWSDTIPTGDTILWMSSRTFSSDGNNDPSWSEPSQATDNEYIDYEWNAYYTTVEEGRAHLPLKDSPKNSHTSPDSNHWYDSPIEGTVLMAVRQVRNGEYVGDWQITKIKGENGDDRKDLDYLKDIFGENVEQGPGAILKEFLGVTKGADTGSTVVAFMNGSNGDNNSFIDPTHGKLMIAAGANGLTDAHNAKFRVYGDGSVFAKDAYVQGRIEATSGSFTGSINATDGVFRGTIYATDGNFNGTINANSGTIGGIDISDNGLSSENFILDSKGNLEVKGIKITNSGFSLSDKTYNDLSAFTATTGNEVNINETINKDIYSEYDSETAQSRYAITYTTDYPDTSFYNLTVNGKQILNIKVTFSVTIETEPDNVDFIIEGISISNPILANNSFIGGVSYYVGKEAVIDSKTYTGTSEFTTVLDTGTYELKSHDSDNLYIVALNENVDLRDWRIKCTYTINNIEITGTLINEGTEIFKNGFGVRSNENNYFFLNRQLNGNRYTDLEYKSNGSGFTVDQKGMRVDTRFSYYQNIRKLGGSDTLNENDNIVMYTGTGNGGITIPVYNGYPIGKTFKIFNFSGNNMKITASSNAIFKPQGDSQSECGLITAGNTHTASQRWVYEIIRIPPITISATDQGGTSQTKECYWLILEY